MKDLNIRYRWIGLLLISCMLVASALQGATNFAPAAVFNTNAPRSLTVDPSGKIIDAGFIGVNNLVTNFSELGFLSGVSAPIQSQIDMRSTNGVLPVKTRFFFMGDSLTEPSSIPWTGGIARWCQFLTNTPKYAAFWSTNVAVSGASMAEIESAQTPKILPLLVSPATGTNDIVFLWDGANDHVWGFNYDANAPLAGIQTWWGKYSNLCYSVRATGAKLAAFSIMPRTSQAPGQEIRRFVSNKMILDGGLWDYYIDAYSQHPDHTDTNDFVDGVHLTASGFQKVANLVDHALRIGPNNASWHGLKAPGWVQVGADMVLQGTDGSIYGSVSNGVVSFSPMEIVNTGIGWGSQKHLTTSLESTALGYASQYWMSNANYNTAVGYGVQQNVTGEQNVGVGNSVQRDIKSGSFDTGIGSFSQRFLTSGNNNTAAGANSQRDLKTGENNTAVGSSAQQSIVASGNNTAVGFAAQALSTNGLYNSALGSYSQYNLRNGVNNNAYGFQSQYSISDGNDNEAYGRDSQYNLTTGGYCTSIGGVSGYSLTTNTYDTCLGYFSSSGTNYGLTALGYKYGLCNSFIGSLSGLDPSLNNGVYHSTALGYNALIEKNYQVILGGRNTLEVKTYGSIVATNGEGAFKSLSVTNPAGVAASFRGADGGYSALRFSSDPNTTGSLSTYSGDVLIGRQNAAGTGSEGQIIIRTNTIILGVGVAGAFLGNVGVGDDPGTNKFYVNGYGKVNGLMSAAGFISGTNEGLSTHIDVLVPGSTTNRMVFSGGILISNISGFHE